MHIVLNKCWTVLFYLFIYSSPQSQHASWVHSTSCTYSCEELWHMVFGFFFPCLWAYFISVLYMLHMSSCEQVWDIMFFLKVSILYYPDIHLAHCCQWVFRHVFLKVPIILIYLNLIIFLYILHMVVSSNKEDSTFHNFLLQSHYPWPPSIPIY